MLDVVGLCCYVWASHRMFLLLLSMGSVLCGSQLAWSAACGIFPSRGSNPRPQVGRQTFYHCFTREVLLIIFYKNRYGLVKVFL